MAVLPVQVDNEVLQKCKIKGYLNMTSGTHYGAGYPAEKQRFFGLVHGGFMYCMESEEQSSAREPRKLFSCGGCSVDMDGTSVKVKLGDESRSQFVFEVEGGGDLVMEWYEAFLMGAYSSGGYEEVEHEQGAVAVTAPSRSGPKSAATSSGVVAFDTPGGGKVFADMDSAFSCVCLSVTASLFLCLCDSAAPLPPSSGVWLLFSLPTIPLSRDLAVFLTHSLTLPMDIPLPHLTLPSPSRSGSRTLFSHAPT